jgi:hypothetical protein
MLNKDSIKYKVPINRDNGIFYFIAKKYEFTWARIKDAH